MMAAETVSPRLVGSEGSQDPPGRGRRPVSSEVELEVQSLGMDPDARPRPAPRPSESAVAVLVVDDDADMRRYVRRALRHIESRVDRVIEAGDGVEALVRFRDDEIGLVISDVVMPVMDGFALSRAIRERTSNRIPILLITGAESERQASSLARAAGAQAVLAKPFNAHTLCRAVEALLEGGVGDERDEGARGNH